MGEHNELKNRLCHIKAKNLPVNKTQRAILKLLLENNRCTYNELAEKLGKTRETVRANLRILEENNLIERVGADKNGCWKVSPLWE